MSLADTVPVTLPGGVSTGGGRRREAVLRPLTGREEELLAATASWSQAARVTALLARCLERLGPGRPAPEGVRDLMVGDRECLLLHLRRATVGDPIDCVLHCSSAECGERLDLRLRTDDLLLPAYEDLAEWHEESFPAEGGRVRVRFRLPTGGDQEAVAELAAADPAGAARRLLERCVDRIVADDGREDGALGSDTAEALADRMAELDPQAELRLEMTCPACGTRMGVLLDMASFFVAEVAGSADRLYEEVHTLASWYHWGEAEILDLPAPRRRRYLELIAARSPAVSRGAA